MALETIHGLVNTFQPETGHLLMLPYAGLDDLPIEGSVTLFAVVAQLQAVAVVLFPVPVTGFAVGGCALHHAVQMTIGAWDCAVFSHEGKIGLVMGDGCPAFILRG